MVQPRLRKRRRRNAHAGPVRGRPPPRLKKGEAAADDAEFQSKYPNLAARRELDRQMHLQRGRETGLTRAQASRHAREHLLERDD